MTERLVFDQGLQPERTALAWRRTGLAMLAGSIVATRVFGVQLGAVALVPTGIAVALAIVVLVGAELRYRRDHRALTASVSDRIPLSGGGMIAVVALAVFLLGGMALALVLLR